MLSKCTVNNKKNLLQYFPDMSTPGSSTTHPQYSFYYMKLYVLHNILSFSLFTFHNIFSSSSPACTNFSSLYSHLHFVSCKYLPAFSNSDVLLLLNNFLCIFVVIYYFLLAACIYGRNVSRQKSCGTSVQGRAMTHAVSCRPFTAEARIPFHASSYEICGERSDTKGGFIPSMSTLPSTAFHQRHTHTFHSSVIDHIQSQ